MKTVGYHDPTQADQEIALAAGKVSTGDAAYRKSLAGRIGDKALHFALTRLAAAGLVEKPVGDPNSRTYRKAALDQGKWVPTVLTASAPPDQAEVAIEAGNVLSGAVATAVTFNSLQLMTKYPSTWDVFAFPVARLNDGFTNYALPPVGMRVADYIVGAEDLEFEPVDPTNPPPVHIDVQGSLDVQTFAIRATAIVEMDVVNVSELFRRGGMQVASFSWAGPHATDSALQYDLNIANHVYAHPLPGGGYDSREFTHESNTAGEPANVTLRSPADPEIVVTSQTGVGLFDLTFLCDPIEGWSVHIVRLR